MNIDEILKKIPNAADVESAKEILVNYTQPFEVSQGEQDLLYAADAFNAYADKLEEMLKLAIVQRDELAELVRLNPCVESLCLKKCDENLARIAESK